MRHTPDAPTETGHEAGGHATAEKPSPLEADLRAAISGDVSFDMSTRGAYSTDASNYRQVPIGVVLPKTVDEVVATVEICRRHGAPITSRGGGTSLAGQACNTSVVIDHSKYLNRVTALDPDRRMATVEPGCTLDTLREAASRHGLTFGPDPATHDRNTMGGMLGNNSCGVHSVLSEIYGPGPLTVHQVREMEVLTYHGQRLRVGPTSDDELEERTREAGPRGDIFRGLKGLRDRYLERIRNGYPETSRRVSGYSLDWLLPENGFDVARALVGTEGTCVVILSATVELVELKPERALVVLGYPDAPTAADHVPEIVGHGPVGLEGIDAKLIDYMERKGLHSRSLKLLPEGGGCLLVEFGGGTRSEAHEQARRMISHLPSREEGGPVAELVEDEADVERIWAIRESGLGATAEVPGLDRTYPGWEDAAVPIDSLGDYLRDFQRLLSRYGYEAALYGHFGQGCIHCRIDFDFGSEEGVADFRSFLDDAADLVVSYGGSLSGEHGDGQARAALLPKMFDAELIEAFRQFKAIWDPDARMNPGKVVDPHPPEEDLRHDPQHPLAIVETRFAFPADDGSFANAASRCVGVGACRDVRSGTMCPSYMATRDERHSTRGRARLLFEMMRGDPIGDQWASEAVHEALHLCLACKACKSECPVEVDMATYKAEFLFHHYEGRLRPRVAYAMGLIYWWARLGSKLPRIANFISSRQPTSAMIKALAGVHPARSVPALSSPTFREWFRRREPSREESRGRVMLWPDTFTTYLGTGPARSAVRVLEDAGFEVAIPPRPLCCGRPLYDWGMLERATALWRQILQVLRPELDSGTTVVGVEPSCVAAFRDELPGLFPEDPDAVRLSRSVMTLAEFLQREGYRPPPLRARAVVQGHCHQAAIMGMGDDLAVLDGMGIDYEHPDAGCCGMAGAFGFEKDKYEVSIQVGERALLPRIREEAPETLLIADGFSCREQIEQTTQRRAMHLSQVIDLALRHPHGEPLGAFPERLGDREPASAQASGK